jgi:hypothetical protein
MKIVCEVIGGPQEGTYEDGNWPNTRSFPISAWASITDDFAVGREVEALSTANLKSGHGKKPKDSGSKHTYVYEVVSCEDTAGVVHVRMEYRGATK